MQAERTTKHLGVHRSIVSTADLQRLISEYEQMAEVLLMIRKWGWIGNETVDPYKPKETDYARPHVLDVTRVLGFIAQKKRSNKS